MRQRCARLHSALTSLAARFLGLLAPTFLRKVRAMRAFVGLNVLEATLRITDRIQLLSCRASMRCARNHHNFPRVGCVVNSPRPRRCWQRLSLLRFMSVPLAN